MFLLSSFQVTDHIQKSRTSYSGSISTSSPASILTHAVLGSVSCFYGLANDLQASKVLYNIVLFVRMNNFLYKTCFLTKFSSAHLPWHPQISMFIPNTGDLVLLLWWLKMKWIGKLLGCWWQWIGLRHVDGRLIDWRLCKVSLGFVRKDLKLIVKFLVQKYRFWCTWYCFWNTKTMRTFSKISQSIHPTHSVSNFPITLYNT